MATDQYGEEIEFSSSVGRVISDGFFPTSPAATVREAIFSEILSGVLGVSPNNDFEDLRSEVVEHEAIERESAGEKVWDVFLKTYTTTGERGARGKEAKRYALPFHPQIARTLKPAETRNWDKWYRMLMTSGSPPSFNMDLHQRFVNRLEKMGPSNIFEQIIIEAAESLEDDSDTEESPPDPIRPYVEECANNFQKDLRIWVGDDHDSSANWLQSTRDLFSFHFMMYYIQVAINLRKEFQTVAGGPPYEYTPRIRDVYFGLWDEQASQDRRFTGEWRERDDEGIERFVYDSWGRLAVLRKINKQVENSNSDIDDNRERYTLSEAVTDLSDRVQNECVESIANLAGFRSDNKDLPTASKRLVQLVRGYYESRSRSNQTPITMGLNVIRQLGEGEDRQYYRTQRGVGPTLRLNRSALRFFARLFGGSSEERHYPKFISYLSRRGINLDSQSESLALEELDEMGLIDRQSDSGGAVYVRTI
jgi:DNA phosphorothioation-dependent restriction protein DptG